MQSGIGDGGMLGRAGAAACLCGVPCLPCGFALERWLDASRTYQLQFNIIAGRLVVFGGPATQIGSAPQILKAANSLPPQNTTTMLPRKSCQRLASPQHLMAANLSPNRTAAPQQRATRRVAVSAAASSPQLPQPIAEPLAFTKALVTVAVRHLTESALDAAADLSIALAEQPRRMREFADEVQAAAVLELQNSGQQQPQRLLSSTSSASSGQNGNSSSGGAGSMSRAAGRPDLEALVDDLRADIAASRALLQQIRAGTPPGSQPGTQSTRRSSR